MAWSSQVAERPTAHPQGSWTLFGIPIHIDRSWFFIAAFAAWSLARGYFPERYPGLSTGLYWAMGGAAALLLFACVLLHELGHSLTAQRHGIPVARVTLFIFGGVAQIGRDPTRPAVELKIALAGPLVSVLIAGACYAGSAAMSVHAPTQLAAVAIVRYLAMTNTALVLFNLLPGFPLDGGRVLRALLWAWTRNLRRATRIASLMGSGLGLGLLVLGLWAIIKGAWAGGMWYILLGFFLRDAALASYRRAREAIGPS